MVTEYAVLSTRKMKTEQIEEKLNTVSKKGWKIKVSHGDCLILVREVEVKG